MQCHTMLSKRNETDSIYIIYSNYELLSQYPSSRLVVPRLPQEEIEINLVLFMLEYFVKISV